MFGKRVVAAAMSAVLTFGMVPTAALADAVPSEQDSLQAQNADQSQSPTLLQELAQPQVVEQPQESELPKETEQTGESEHQEITLNESPAPVLEDEDQKTHAAIEYRINAVDDAALWTIHATAGDAVDAATNDQATPIEKLELRLVKAEGELELRTRAVDEAWPEEQSVDLEAAEESLASGTIEESFVPESTDEKTTDVIVNPALPEVADKTSAMATKPFADLQLRLDVALSQAYDVWYRLHVDGQWLAWAKNGESAAPNNKTASATDLQVMLLTKDESKQFVDSSYGTRDAMSEQQLEQMPEEETTGDLSIATQTATDNNSSSSEQPAADAQAQAQAQATATNPKQPKEPNATKKSSTVAAEATTVVPKVTYRAYGQGYGWQKAVSSGAIAGTTGQSKRMEGIKISLPKGVEGSITYRACGQGYRWQKWAKNNALAGTTKKSKRMEAIQIKLTGQLAEQYDVWYRVYGQGYGWQKWVKNGATAGKKGKSKRIEAIQITLVPKGGELSAEVEGKDPLVKASINYRASLQKMGWLGWTGNGDVAGVAGASTAINGFVAKFAGLDDADLHYKAYARGSGWLGEVTGGTRLGKVSSSKQLEAFTMRLTGIAAENYDIYYRTYVGDYGWLAWAKNGEKAGSTAFKKRVEAVQVVLVVKDGQAPSGGSKYDVAFIDMPTLTYRGRVQSNGWMGWVKNGKVAGTTGKSLRMEALQATITSAHSGSIQILPYVEGKGWTDWVNQGRTAGASKGKRMEAVRIRLTGELAKYYDVWYRTYSQGVGWMGWTKNGRKAGVTDISARMEAIRITIRAKGAGAPGSTTRPYLNGANVSKLGYQNPKGYYQVSRFSVRITDAAQSPWNYVTPSRIGVFATREQCINAFVGRAREYLGAPYMWNYSCAPGVGVDCIGLVYQCAYACGMNMGIGTGTNDFNPWAHYVTGYSGWHSHDANNFWNYGRAKHVSLGSRSRGDLISYPGHVAVYLGNDTVIEAIMGAGVVQRNMYDSGYPRGVIRLFQ